MHRRHHILLQHPIAVGAAVGQRLLDVHEPSPRGRVLLRLLRHRARYLDLFQAADDARDARAAAEWDLALMRVERNIAGTACPLTPRCRTKSLGRENGEEMPCVTSVAGPHGGAQLYER